MVVPRSIATRRQCRRLPHANQINSDGLPLIAIVANSFAIQVIFDLARVDPSL